MQNLKTIEHLEVTENGAEKCAKIFQVLGAFKMPKISHFFEIQKKTKKLSPGKGLKKAHAKFEDDRAFRSSRKRRWKIR